jgi:hypothetical protein
VLQDAEKQNVIWPRFELGTSRSKIWHSCTIAFSMMENRCFLYDGEQEQLFISLRGIVSYPGYVSGKKWQSILSELSIETFDKYYQGRTHLAQP